MFVERLRSRVSIIRYPLYPNKSRTNTGVVVLLRRSLIFICDAKSRPLFFVAHPFVAYQTCLVPSSCGTRLEAIKQRLPFRIWNLSGETTFCGFVPCSFALLQSGLPLSTSTIFACGHGPCATVFQGWPATFVASTLAKLSGN